MAHPIGFNPQNQVGPYRGPLFPNKGGSIMVKGQQNLFTDVIEESRKSFEATIQAGQRIMDEAGRTWSRVLQMPANGQDFRLQWEQWNKEAVPFMKEAVETTTKAFQRQFEVTTRTMNGIKSPNGEEGGFDPQNMFRDGWTQTQNVTRNTMDIFADTGVAMMKAWSNHFTCCPGCCSPKAETSAKPVKEGK